LGGGCFLNSVLSNIFVIRPLFPFWKLTHKAIGFLGSLSFKKRVLSAFASIQIGVEVVAKASDTNRESKL
jgi:hypothetical protein